MTESRGMRNNNPLNIRKGNHWQGESHPQTDTQFEQFKSIEWGTRAALILIRNYIQGTTSTHIKYDTLNKLISRWAPPSENNTRGYIQVVSEYSDIHPYEKLDFCNRAQMVELVRAMAFVECGEWLDRAMIRSAYELV